MKYKITHSYNWYEIEKEKFIIKTYHINGISFTFDEISKIFQDHPDIIDEANKNFTYTPEYFYLKSSYLIEEEAHPCFFNIDIENPEDLPEDLEVYYN
jgi:hypothetical protein